MLDQIPQTVKDVGPGVLGAALAFFLDDRGMKIGLVLFFGGCIVAAIGTEFVADRLALIKYQGLVGFLLGAFGMLFLAKFFDMIVRFDLLKLANEFGEIFKAIVKKKGGLND